MALLVYILALMGLIMKEVFKKANFMEKGSFNLKMGMSIRDILLMGSIVVREDMIFQMEDAMKGNGKMANIMGSGHSHGQMEISIQAGGRIVDKMELER